MKFHRPVLRTFSLALFSILLLPNSPQAGSPADAQPFAEAVRSRLDQLVAFDTVNPPGDERLLCEQVGEELKSEGIEAEVLGPEGPRANLIARVRATKKSRKAPLLIVAHIDTVNFSREVWGSDPLKLTEREGFLYGRGVIDNKGMAAAGIEILRRLHRERQRLARDVVLLLAADEEAGGKVGTAWLLEHHPDEVAAAYVLNEGGDVRLIGGEVAYVGVQTTEKIFRNIELEALGQDGHSSMPLPENAIARLGAAVAAAAAVEFPFRSLPTTQAFATGVAQTLEEPLRSAVAAVAQVEPGEPIPAEVANVLAADPFFGAFFRTTCVPTLLSAGTRSNALPAKASATLNCRLLPGDSLEEVGARLREVVAPFDVSVSHSDKPKLSPISPESGRFFEATRRAVSRTWPSAALVPFMSTGGTDCRRFRGAGAACYGLLPFPLTADDERRMHGTDERMTTQSLAEGSDFLWQLVLELSRR